MLDHNEKIKSIYEFIRRSEEESKHPYAYDIYLIQGMERTAFAPRTTGSEKFLQDIATVVERAKQSNCLISVEIFGGKSPNSKHVNSYTLNPSGHKEPEVKIAEVQTLIKEEVRQATQQSNEMGLSGLNNFIGALSGKTGGAEGLEGLVGLVTTLSGNNSALEKVNYQKQIDDFKAETRYNILEEKFQALQSENAELKAKKELYESENRQLANDKTDLEGRLAEYAPNELVKRVAVGVLSGIGGRILSNSPKTAELLGLTPTELKGALGIVDEGTGQNEPGASTTNVEIEQVEQKPLSPEEQQKAEIIKRLSEALQDNDLSTNTKIINIVALCLEHGLLDKTLGFIKASLQEATQPNN